MERAETRAWRGRLFDICPVGPMGTAGSDTAIETTDVALTDDDLEKLPQFIELSRATRRTLVQNIGMAVVI